MIVKRADGAEGDVGGRRRLEAVLARRRPIRADVCFGAPREPRKGPRRKSALLIRLERSAVVQAVSSVGPPPGRARPGPFPEEGRPPSAVASLRSQPRAGARAAEALGVRSTRRDAAPCSRGGLRRRARAAESARSFALASPRDRSASGGARPGDPSRSRIASQSPPPPARANRSPPPMRTTARSQTGNSRDGDKRTRGVTPARYGPRRAQRRDATFRDRRTHFSSLPGLTPFFPPPPPSPVHPLPLPLSTPDADRPSSRTP